MNRSEFLEVVEAMAILISQKNRETSPAKIRIFRFSTKRFNQTDHDITAPKWEMFKFSRIEKSGNLTQRSEFFLDS